MIKSPHLIPEMMCHELAPSMTAVVHETLERSPYRFPCRVLLYELEQMFPPRGENAPQIRGHCVECLPLPPVCVWRIYFTPCN